jgi:hypothetical protein
MPIFRKLLGEIIWGTKCKYIYIIIIIIMPDSPPFRSYFLHSCVYSCSWFFVMPQDGAHAGHSWLTSLSKAKYWWQWSEMAWFTELDISDGITRAAPREYQRQYWYQRQRNRHVPAMVQRSLSETCIHATSACWPPQVLCTEWRWNIRSVHANSSTSATRVAYGSGFYQRNVT